MSKHYKIIVLHSNVLTQPYFWSGCTVEQFDYERIMEHKMGIFVIARVFLNLSHLL